MCHQLIYNSAVAIGMLPVLNHSFLGLDLSFGKGNDDHPLLTHRWQNGSRLFQKMILLN